MGVRKLKMTEASVKRDRDDGKTDVVAVDIQAANGEGIPQAAVEEEDMVGPMLPPPAKKRKVRIFLRAGTVHPVCFQLYAPVFAGS